jgi:plasmid maintenance system killer protein
VNIVFRSAKLEKTCSIEKQGIREWGPKRARIIQRRLEQLAALSDLKAVGALPPFRCHELKGRRTGTFAVDIDERVRLIFEPAPTPPPLLADGGIDLAKVTAICVLEVADYHGD